MREMFMFWLSKMATEAIVTIAIFVILVILFALGAGRR